MSNTVCKTRNSLSLKNNSSNQLPFIYIHIYIFLCFHEIFAKKLREKISANRTLCKSDTFSYIYGSNIVCMYAANKHFLADGRPLTTTPKPAPSAPPAGGPASNPLAALAGGKGGNLALLAAALKRGQGQGGGSPLAALAQSGGGGGANLAALAGALGTPFLKISPNKFSNIFNLLIGNGQGQAPLLKALLSSQGSQAPAPAVQPSAPSNSDIDNLLKNPKTVALIMQKLGLTKTSQSSNGVANVPRSVLLQCKNI